LNKIWTWSCSKTPNPKALWCYSAIYCRISIHVFLTEVCNQLLFTNAFCIPSSSQSYWLICSNSTLRRRL